MTDTAFRALLGLDPTPSGDTFDADRDGNRLATLHDRVYAYMADGQWRTLHQIARECGGTEASVSARLRDMRREKYGAHKVHRQHLAHGLWVYSLEVAE